MDFVLIERTAPQVAEIVLNRPEKHNAVTPEMAAALRDVTRGLADDDDCRVVILRGAGEKAFCAGTDIGSLETYADAWAFRHRVDYATQIRNLRKPVIAAIKGWCVGGGFELALAADVRVSARSAKFGAPEVKLGWVGGGGSTQMLVRLIGYGRAMRLLLTGSTIDAQQAFDQGIVEELVEDGDELATARSLAAEIAKHHPVATQAVKEAVRAAMSSTLDAGLRHENDLMILSFALNAHQSGVDHFKKRKGAEY
jgi:enoyl-CoA hydratase